MMTAGEVRGRRAVRIGTATMPDSGVTGPDVPAQAVAMLCPRMPCAAPDHSLAVRSRDSAGRSGSRTSHPHTPAAARQTASAEAIARHPFMAPLSVVPWGEPVAEQASAAPSRASSEIAVAPGPP
jgi:hypothetical protein